MSLNNSIADTNEKAKAVSEKFINSTYDYYKLKAFQQLSGAVDILIKTILIGSILVIALSFFAVSLALFIGEILDNYTQGFLVAGAIFIVFAIIAILLKKHISNFVVKVLSEKFFN